LKISVSSGAAEFLRRNSISSVVYRQPTKEDKEVSLRNKFKCHDSNVEIGLIFCKTRKMFNSSKKYQQMQSVQI
jgi:hypothetical protein